MLKSFFHLNKELWTNRKIAFAMGKAEFKNEYVGSALGIVWGVLKPFMLVAVYSLVFQNQINGIPFVLWVIPGLFLWTFLSDSLVSGTTAIRGNSHLVKKVVFPVSILPLTKIISNLFNHLIFMVFAIIILVLNNYPLNIQMIQLVYYMFAAIVFTVGLTRLTSAMAVMSVDIIHFIVTVMQLLFWSSPVLWSPNSSMVGFASSVLPILKLNPYFYLLEGYRSCFFSSTWFWENPKAMIYFWGVTALLYVVGSLYYAKNRKEFADVL